MPIFQLLGDNGNYLFDPENKKLVLKENGKFCSVYLGINKDNKQKVVIKKLNPALVKNLASVERFKLESALNIRHPNLTAVLDYITHQDDHYIVRTFVDGTDMQKFSKSKTGRKKELLSFYLRCAVGILNALEELHKNKIIHCDIRPSNMVIGFDANEEINFSNPDIRLIDFGLAKRNEQQAKIHERIPFALIYSPPEQVLNEAELVNATSDLYSLGISLYEMISGESPFANANPEKLMNLQINQNIEKHPLIPASVFKILRKATNKEIFSLPPNRYSHEQIVEHLLKGQKNRYISATEFREEVLKILE